ncbi:Uncharacterised protein [Bordetella ansorpii]|jgi:hypothetical protein|uniref:Uncharacterized protein n=1 Tax=Bordetella ansorpii TaxID=288768 RepID=A0A157RB04_9BORD|nr:hypothetical protein [Bordetella ansorpii]SAI55241.1 Uncharacterised protein [Bordetella ansorpii]SAI74544.1 Uncharacterised protein [Bordetella ansorpii]
MSVMCPACRSITAGLSGVSPHGELGYQGFTSPTQQGRENNRVEHFRCVRCESKWLRETDRWGFDMGFRLAP